MIARELSPADRIRIGQRDFVVGLMPDHTDEDHVTLLLVEPSTGAQSTLTCLWNYDFQLVDPRHDIVPGDPRTDHPSQGHEDPL